MLIEKGKIVTGEKVMGKKGDGFYVDVDDDIGDGSKVLWFCKGTVVSLKARVKQAGKDDIRYQVYSGNTDKNYINDKEATVVLYDCKQKSEKTFFKFPKDENVDDITKYKHDLPRGAVQLKVEYLHFGYNKERGEKRYYELNHSSTGETTGKFESTKEPVKDGRRVKWTHKVYEIIDPSDYNNFTVELYTDKDASFFKREFTCDDLLKTRKKAQEYARDQGEGNSGDRVGISTRFDIKPFDKYP